MSNVIDLSDRVVADEEFYDHAIIMNEGTWLTRVTMDGCVITMNGLFPHIQCMCVVMNRCHLTLNGPTPNWFLRIEPQSTPKGPFDPPKGTK